MRKLVIYLSSKKTKRTIANRTSDFCVNLGAGWFGLAIITPNFLDLSILKAFSVLLADILFGILFLALSVIISRKI